MDGVQESRSSNASLETYCVKFKDCKNIYPLRIIRPNEKYKFNAKEQLSSVISDINSAGMIIHTGVCDNPKRSFCKNHMSSSGKHGCDYCEAPAIFYKDNTMKKGHLTWPPSTMNGRPRTITGIKRIVKNLEEEDPNVTKDYLKGVKGRSVLLDQNNFDVIHDLPAEYMHSMCIGCVKKLLELTYKLSKNKPVVTKNKKIDPKLFNDLMASVLVAREFSRRCRNLDTSIYKAQEYRNVILFFFPIILENLPESYKKERQIWLSLVFMVRSCVIPNEEFSHVNQAQIVNSCELFYNLFHELYGQRNCAYSIHIVSTHLLKIRGNAPLTERSAFPFEAFYAEMKKLYKAGTSSPLKQIIANAFMKRSTENHNCKTTILYQERKDSENMENNSMIYTFNNNTYEIYIITSIDNGVYTCKRQGKFKFSSTLLPTLDWSSIGVFRQGAIGSKIYQIPREDIKGKVINVLNMLITCPENVLREK